MAGRLHLVKDHWGTRHPVIEQRLLRFPSLSVHQRHYLTFWTLPDTVIHQINVPQFHLQQRFNKKGQLMRVGSKWGGQTGLRCFCTAAEENICSFKVTWRGKKKTVARGVSSVLLQPHRDEMLQQADSRPSQNNSRKCQTSVSEMRPGEVSGTFCDPPPLRPKYPPTSTSSQTGWLQGNRKRQKKEHTAMCTRGWLRVASCSVFVTHSDEPSSRKRHRTDTLAASE